MQTPPTSDSPIHGSLLSWIRDGLLGGLGFALVGWAETTTFVLALYSANPNWHKIAIAVAVCAAVGALLGPLVAALAWWLAARSRLLSLLAAVSGATFGVWVAMNATFIATDSRPHIDLAELLLVFAFGGCAAGAPCAAYLAVRIRGRSGLAVLFGSALWLCLPIGLAFLGAEML